MAKSEEIKPEIAPQTIRQITAEAMAIQLPDREEVHVILAAEADLDRRGDIYKLALQLISEGHTVNRTAEIIGLRPGTLWARASRPEFVAALALHEPVRQAQLRQKTEKLADVALDTLQDVMQDSDVAAKDRVAAAKEVLRIAIPDQKVPVIQVDARQSNNVFDERLMAVLSGAAAEAEAQPEVVDAESEPV